MTRLHTLNMLCLAVLVSFSILIFTEGQPYFRVLFLSALVIFLVLNYDIPVELNRHNLWALFFFFLYVATLYLSYFSLILDGWVAFSAKSAVGPILTFFIFVAILLYVPAFLFRSVAVEQLLVSFCLFGLIFCGLSLAFDVVSGLDMVFGLPKLQGFLYNTNSLGVTTSFFACAAFVLALFFRRTAFYLLFLFFFLFLVLTFTRSRILSTVLACLVIYLIHKRISMKTVLTLLGIGILFAAVAFVLRDYLVILATQGGKAFTRYYVWMSAIDALRASPFLGYSMDYLDLGLIADFQRELVGMEKVGVGVHNTHLHVLLQSGIVGFTLYSLAVLPIFFRYLKRSVPRESADMLWKMTLISFSLNGFFGNFFEIGALGTFSISPTLCTIAYGVMCLHLRVLDEKAPR